MNHFKSLWAIAQQFMPNSNQGGDSHPSVMDIQPFGKGNINDTYLVSWGKNPLEFTSQTPHNNSHGTSQFVLQRINTLVFSQPHQVMENIRLFCNHAHHRLPALLHQLGNFPPRRWEIPHIMVTLGGKDYWEAEDGTIWRSLSFIDHTQSFDILHTHQQAEEVGYGLGMFHSLISDLPPYQLTDTLAGFHITPLYLQKFLVVSQQNIIPQTPEVGFAIRFIDDRKNLVDVLEAAKHQGKLPLRLIHGDPKVNNILFDTRTEQAVSIIDLDTIKPGLIHYDIGDCLRSGCNPLGEETMNWQAVQFDSDRCQHILQGYLSVAKSFLSPNDYMFLYDAIRLIAFELGLRFFTDFLAGNVYFKVNEPKQNLHRALVQFQLTASIEAQERTLRRLMHDLTPPS